MPEIRRRIIEAIAASGMMQSEAARRAGMTQPELSRGPAHGYMRDCIISGYVLSKAND